VRGKVQLFILSFDDFREKLSVTEARENCKFALQKMLFRRIFQILRENPKQMDHTDL
jgi:hypothetical protein